MLEGSRTTYVVYAIEQEENAKERGDGEREGRGARGEEGSAAATDDRDRSFARK